MSCVESNPFALNRRSFLTTTAGGVGLLALEYLAQSEAPQQRRPERV